MKRIGWGQVEPNHLSAQRTGQIYAQLPVAAGIDVLENGSFVKYDYANGEVNRTGAGEWMLVLNEVKLYDSRETYKDYAMNREDCANGIMVPRVFKTNVGDIFTTNCVANDETEYSKKDELKIDTATGMLSKTGNDDSGMVWVVVDVYTMPDGQPGIKVQRIA